VPPCSQLTVKGDPCKQPAMRGSDRCAFHLKARGGPKTQLDDELVDRLVSVLRTGGYLTTARLTVGLARGTFDDWMRRGRSDRGQDEPYRRFRARIKAAQAEGEAINVAHVAQAARDDWHAAAWILERTHPERWGPPATRLRLEQPTPVEEQVPVESDPFAEVDELAERRRHHAGG
jgi:hypothetical protein